MSEIKPKPCPFYGSSDVDICPEGERADGNRGMYITSTAITINVMGRSSLSGAAMSPTMQHARHRSIYGTGGQNDCR